jgi:hypothetical protein
MNMFSTEGLFKKTRHTGLPLWVEISLILLVKIALLFGLWKFFFSHPQTKHMSLPKPVVEEHFLSARTAKSKPNELQANNQTLPTESQKKSPQAVETKPATTTTPPAVNNEAAPLKNIKSN